MARLKIGAGKDGHSARCDQANDSLAERNCLPSRFPRAGPAALDGGNDAGTGFRAEHPLDLALAAWLGGLGSRSRCGTFYFRPPCLLGGGDAGSTFRRQTSLLPPRFRASRSRACGRRDLRAGAKERSQLRLQLFNFLGNGDGSFELVDRWGCGHIPPISDANGAFRQLYN